MKLLLFVPGLLLGLTICIEDNQRVESEVELNQNFPEVVHPVGNEYSENRWKLGKRLFFDPILSRDSSISCASCHNPRLAFSDSVQFSTGVAGRLGVRNAPTLANVAFHPYFTRDGGVPSLEQQILVPIQEHVEFDFNILKIADRMLKDSTYNDMSLKAYGQHPNSEVITKALACFERTLISKSSSFDAFAQGDSSSLTAAQKRGMKSFFSSEIGCSNCHSGFNFTNYSFQNNGLYLHYTDSGRYRLTLKEEDRALFKVPSLRNVELTGPYMHDGSLSTLSEVVEHYSTGIKSHKNLSSELKPLNLSKSEKDDLVAFLKSLTDNKFILENTNY